jgi:hypothetical protein
MGRARTIRYSACGCVFLLWAGSALAETTASLSPDTNEESNSSAATSPAANSPFATDDCQVTDDCIDQYLWSLYERTPKIDAIKVSEKQKVTVKRKGKTRTVVKTVTKIVDEDFTWKDFKAADKAELSPMAYVIGGIDRNFKRTLYRALRAIDDAGLVPGITSAFRDDYRQAIASGNKAQTDRSYHGGSTRGGYGHGLAVDLVSVKGATRAERWRSSDELWTWIDAHGRDVGIGRPYLDRDAPHVAPIDGEEYAKHRGGATTRLAAAKTTLLHRPARRDVRRAQHASKIASSKLQTSHGRAHQSAVSAKGRARKSAT